MEAAKQELLKLIDEVELDEETKEKIIGWIKNLSMETLSNNGPIFMQGTGSNSKT